MSKRSHSKGRTKKSQWNKKTNDEKPRKKIKSTHGMSSPSGADNVSPLGPSEEGNRETWSKSKKKRMRKVLAKLKKEGGGVVAGSSGRQNKADTAPTTSSEDAICSQSVPSTQENTGTTKKASMQDAFKARLAGSRFRILNEELYTTTSKESFDRFSSNPDLFEQYHEGFRHQVESWPENPVDVIVRSLKVSFKNKPCVVADFGCGDAQLAKDLLRVRHNGKSPFTVHSFDLVAPNELVTACDMANVPLGDKSVDVCVFCLSLMGTNLADFVREAHRVLKDNGRVKIAEVRSRIEYSHSKKGKDSLVNNKAETGPKVSDSKKKAEKEKLEGTLDEFVAVLGKLGFKCINTDRSNTMFLLLELKKNGKKPDPNLTFAAKPCIYKRR